MKRIMRSIVSFLLLAVMTVSFLGSVGTANAAAPPLKYFSCLNPFYDGMDTACVQDGEEQYAYYLTRGQKVPLNGWVLSNICVDHYEMKLACGKKTSSIAVATSTYPFPTNFVKDVNTAYKPTVYTATNSGWAATIDTALLSAGTWTVSVTGHYIFNRTNYSFKVATLTLVVSEPKVTVGSLLGVAKSNLAVAYNTKLTVDKLNSLVPPIEKGYYRTWICDGKEINSAITVKSDLTVYYTDKPNKIKVAFEVNGNTSAYYDVFTGDLLSDIIPKDYKDPQKKGYYFVGWSPTNSFTDMYLNTHIFFNEEKTRSVRCLTLHAMFVKIGAPKATEAAYIMSLKEATNHKMAQKLLFEYFYERVQALKPSNTAQGAFKKGYNFIMTPLFWAGELYGGKTKNPKVMLGVAALKALGSIIPSEDPEYVRYVMCRDTCRKLYNGLENRVDNWNAQGKDEAFECSIWHYDGNYTINFKDVED